MTSTQSMSSLSSVEVPFKTGDTEWRCGGLLSTLTTKTATMPASRRHVFLIVPILKILSKGEHFCHPLFLCQPMYVHIYV
jgi:hypothetical protein